MYSICSSKPLLRTRIAQSRNPSDNYTGLSSLILPFYILSDTIKGTSRFQLAVFRDPVPKSQEPETTWV